MLPPIPITIQQNQFDTDFPHTRLISKITVASGSKGKSVDLQYLVEENKDCPDIDDFIRFLKSKMLSEHQIHWLDGKGMPVMGQRLSGLVYMGSSYTTSATESGTLMVLIRLHTDH